MFHWHFENIVKLSVKKRLGLIYMDVNSKEWISDFLKSRRTTRDFSSKEVSPALIDELLEDFLTAPSWSNTRPFKVAVATGERRNRLSAEFQKRWAVLSDALRGSWWKKIKLVLRWYGLPTSNWSISRPYVAELKPRSQRVGKELYEFIGIQRGDRKKRDEQWGRNYDFFGAPVEIFIYIHKSLHIFAANDAGLALENLILSNNSQRSNKSMINGAASNESSQTL